MLEIKRAMTPWLRLCLQATCLVLAGDLVPVGATLVTPDIESVTSGTRLFGLADLV